MRFVPSMDSVPDCFAGLDTASLAINLKPGLSWDLIISTLCPVTDLGIPPSNAQGISQWFRQCDFLVPKVSFKPQFSQF